jgi:uncharacterized membrane protein YbhN (UPF0104 family)
VAGRTPRVSTRTHDGTRPARPGAPSRARAQTETPEARGEGDQGKKKPGIKKYVSLAIKLAFTAAMLFVIFDKVLARDGAEDLKTRIANLDMRWVLAAVGMQLSAIVCAIVRWQRLLVGQGIHAPWRFLGGSFMIARFWGAFTPGGFTGFGGWRIFDIADRTGKVARAGAVISVEMIMGQLAFGLVVMMGSVFGSAFIGTMGVVLVNLGFAVIVSIGLTFLARPHLFRVLAGFLPANIRARIHTLIDAVCAYQGKNAAAGAGDALGRGRPRVQQPDLRVRRARARSGAGRGSRVLRVVAPDPGHVAPHLHQRPRAA